MLSMLNRLNGMFDRIPYDVVALALRVFPATVFLLSGRTKVEGLFSIKDSTWFLFETEFALPLIPSNLAAVLATTAEHVLPVLMILGLATRLSAFGLLGMTAVIQIFVYPSAWATHGLWASALLALVAGGPGALSLDRLFGLDGATKPGAGRLAPAE
jgi:putative oxidoreductase